MRRSAFGFDGLDDAGAFASGDAELCHLGCSFSCVSWLAGQYHPASRRVSGGE
jgi:hypothetical protein